MLLRLTLLTLFATPQTPDATLPPPTAVVRLTAVGHGVQIYRCAAEAGRFQWALVGPEATLFDPGTREPVGTHTPGPTWTWNDGSSLTGTVLQKQPSSDPANIPSLLLETHAAGDKSGVLTGITLVRRSETQAGAAPAEGCDAAHQENLLRVPYQAIYTFYAAK